MLDVLWAMLGGLGLGMLFYGGLWWTVSQLPDFRRPALILLGSALLRMGAMLGGLYWVAGGEWLRMLPCVLGVLIARLAVTWATRLPSPRGAAEIRHAP